MHHILIEHPVVDFETWKQAYESDPLGRRASGVTSFRVYRPVDDPLYVLVDLEFGTLDQAEAFLPRLHAMWEKVQGSLIGQTQGRIVELIEAEDL